MTEYYEQQGSLARCVRSSPIASLLGFILVLVGVGVFGGAAIFGRRNLIAILNQPHLLPCLDYMVYGLLGATVLFSMLTYLLCSLSSGWNAKHCYDSSRKSLCGRCCTMMLIVCLVIGIILWVLVLSLTAYSFTSIAFIIYRESRLPSTLQDGFSLDQMKKHVPFSSSVYKNVQRIRRAPPQKFTGVHSLQTNLADLSNPEFDWSMNENSMDQHSRLPDATGVNDVEWQPSTVSEPTPIQPRASNESAIHGLGDHITGFRPETVLPGLPSNVEKILSTGMDYVSCTPAYIDLSYYGLYAPNDLAVCVPRKDVAKFFNDVLICSCIAVAGILLVILGYLQIVICMAMNFARLQEKRYYEPSEAGEEGVALQQ